MPFQCVPSPTEILKQRSIYRTVDAISDMSLTGHEGRQPHLLRPRFGVECVVLQPFMAVGVGVGISATVESVKVGVTVSRFEQVSVAVGGGGCKRVGRCTHIVVPVPIEGFRGLFPWREQTFIVERSHFVNASQSLIGLHPTGIFVRNEEPLEVSAHAVAGTLGQQCLLAQQTGECFFRIAIGPVESERAPCPVFAVEELVRMLEFPGIVVGTSTVGSAPVLHHIPVCSLTAIASGDGPLVDGRRVELADDSPTLLRKVFRQHALILQSPEYDARRVAPFLDPLAQFLLEVGAKFGRVVPDVGGKLAPEKHPLLIEQLSVVEVVGLVGLTESIETGLAYLLDARSYLLVRESVTASEKMFILASAVDEDRFSVEQKPMCVGCRTLTG